MIEKIVKEKSTALFRQRVKDAEFFWQRANEDKRKLILGTSMLIDGDISRGKELFDQLSPSFHTKFNLMSAYKWQNDLVNYEQLREEIIEQYEVQLNSIESKPVKKTVAFFLSYLGNTGAMKMLLTHKEWLEEDGFQVDLFVPYSEKNKVLPYSLFNKTYELKTYSSDKDLRKISNKYDIGFAPHWDHLLPLQQNFKKVFFFTQGDYDVFSDNQNTINLLRQFYWLPFHLFTVSDFLQQHVFRKQLRIPQVIPCGIDINLFQPGEKFEKTTILVVGSASVVQKRISEVLTHLLILKQHYDFEIVWINPLENIKEVEGIKVVNNPDQQTLAMYFRRSHIYVSGSEIESFSLPPLEAMSSGTPVVSANNGGILQYGKHNENLLLFESNNWGQMTKLVEELLTDESKRKILGLNGLETAKEYEINKVKQQFLDYVHNAVEQKFILN